MNMLDAEIIINAETVPEYTDKRLQAVFGQNYGRGNRKRYISSKIMYIAK